MERTELDRLTSSLKDSRREVAKWKRAVSNCKNPESRERAEYQLYLANLTFEAIWARWSAASDFGRLPEPHPES